MAKYVINTHTWNRWAERGPVGGDLEKELEKGVLFGAQKGDGFLVKLPCNCVAAGYRSKKVYVITTILTMEMAIANMQCYINRDIFQSENWEKLEIAPEAEKPVSKKKGKLKHFGEIASIAAKHAVLLCKESNQEFNKDSEILSHLGCEEGSPQHVAYRLAVESCRQFFGQVIKEIALEPKDFVGICD